MFPSKWVTRIVAMNLITYSFGSKAMRQTKMLEFIEEARFCQAAYPHDNVYALYGILTACGIQLPRPDYSKPVADVYR